MIISKTTAVALFASLVAAHTFPYVPTQILMPSGCSAAIPHCDGQDVAYIFSQGDDDAGVEFRALNFSSAVGADVELDTLTDGELPFLKDAAGTTAFGATRTGNGTLMVYAGDCESGTGQVWSYSSEEGEWVKRDMGDSDDDDELRGPYFLGGTVAFSSTLAPDMDQPTIYTYGGMCASPQTSDDDWQTSGNYTKTMMSLLPETSHVDTGYSLRVASDGGPRTPMAGFTFTPLTPSMTNKSGIVTQQASFVLLGGHTQQAFINMSTAAVWNLPAESWTYVSIQAPSNDMYSRSGHTAVLSEDGGSIIILGGWVGDVNTVAEPQLAVLEMSQAYSSWKWTIPEDQPDTDGIYGHGAAVLPGNVMMVYGGWEMSSSGTSSSKIRRRASTSPRFLNLTSMAWSDSYKNPGAGSSDGDESSQSAPSEQQNMSGTKRLGLGLGLGLGLPLTFALTFVFLCWRATQKKHRKARDRALKAFSQDSSRYMNDHDEMTERDEYMWGANGLYTPYQPESDRGGALHMPPRPFARQMRGAGYVPTATRPMSFASIPGGIHPIYEDDEEEEPYRNSQAHDVQTPTSEAPSDPFLTPSAGANPPSFFPLPASRASATPSPESPRRHDPEVQDWVSDVDAADAMLARMNTRHGRTSPTRRNSASLRDDESRHGSNLSEAARSAADSLGQQQQQSPTEWRTKTTTTTAVASSTLLGGSTLLGAADIKPGSSGSSSYNTAKSSFHALRIEGPSLLLGRASTYNHNNDDEDLQPPGSPSKSKPRRGWLGSLRRVFSTSGSSNRTNSFPEDDQHHRPSLDRLGSGVAYEQPGLVGLRGELLRRKQGRQDWEDELRLPETGAGETDWDIERAVEQRLVQVMFTVPRERLRVVNADEKDDEAIDDDDEEGGGVAVVVPQAPQKAVLVDPDKNGSVSSRSDNGGVLHRQKSRQDVVVDGEKKRPSSPQQKQQPLYPGLYQPPPLEDDKTSTIPSGSHRRQTSQVSSTFLTVETASLEPRFSHETDDSLGRRSSGVVLEAQAVPLTRTTERPRTTRVLQMVDSFETMRST